MDLTSVAAVKAWASINVSADDALLATLVTAYSAWVRAYTNRDFTTATYAITRSGRDEQLLHMPQWPITDVTSLVINGSAVPRQIEYGSYGYRFSERAIVLDGLRFWRGFENIDITFVAGAAQPPVDIAQAVTELCALHYKNRQHLGIASKTLANETITFMTRAMPDTVKSILAQNKAVVPL